MKSDANFAFSEAMRMSQFSVRSIPQPTAGPFTAQMIGFSHSIIARVVGITAFRRER